MVCRIFNKCGSGEDVYSDNSGEGVSMRVMLADPMDGKGEDCSVGVNEFKCDGVGEESGLVDSEQMGVFQKDIKQVG